MEILFAVIILIVIVVFISWLHESRPLAPQEEKDLAFRRRMTTIYNNYGFAEYPLAVNYDFKKRLKANGKLYHLDEPLQNFPAIAAGLLKGKKHEWIIIAFSDGNRILASWFNKGRDGTQVTPLISVEALLGLAQKMNASTILEFHNHPNSNPSLYSTSSPSERDRLSAEFYGKLFIEKGLTYLAFITERGIHSLYACWVPVSFMPLDLLLNDIKTTNNTSRSVNLSLRQELRVKHKVVSLLGQPNASHNIFATADHSLSSPGSISL